ncbi:T9SS type A sorting domain-containing protein [candidate division WOR-3 bacterium]|nr:T9SS type A sorting domain-containing protein [candidate division WOR-3 bacterium]
MKKALLFVLCVGLLPMLLAATNMDKINTDPAQPKEAKELPESFFPNAAVRSTGGPDDFGYTWIDSDEPGGPVFNWIEISGTGTPTAMADDDHYWPIPFTFTFYGVTYDNIAVGSNGGVYFQDTYLTLGNTALPSTASNIYQLIAPYWDDLNPNASGADDVYYQIIGNTLVIEWHQVPRYAATNYMTFEVILDASTGDIIFQYLTLSGETGSSATVGIQGSETQPPVWYLQYSYNTASLHDNLAIKFSAAPGVLYVDDDDAPAVSGYFETSFSNLGIAYDIWVVTDSGDVTPDASVMGTYDIVVWTTGDDYSSTFVGNDTIEVANYLAGGGKMWLSSEDILYHLGPVSWLHVASYFSDIGCVAATGVGPIMTGTSFATTGGVVSDYADEIYPDAFAWTEMQNETPVDNTIAMDVTTGLPYYLFFQSFPFENINAEADRDTMMQRVFIWLFGTHDVGTNAIVEPPTSLLPTTTVDPTAIYANTGTYTETFDVYFTIDSAGVNVYYETANITLDVGDDTTIVWPSWTAGPAPGIVYDVTAYTDLTYDEHPSNDTLTQQTITAAWTSWEPYTAPSMNFDRLTNATVYDSDNDMIYMIGGTPSGQPGSQVNYNYAYDPVTDTWNTSLSPMPTPHGWIQGAYWDGKIYVIGGLDNAGSAINNTEIYDIAGDAWSTGTPIPQAVLAHGTVAWNGNIYVIGGWNGVSSGGFTTVYRYDIAGDAWTSATALPQEFDMGGVTIWDNVIYLCGGVLRTASAAYTHVYSGTIDAGNPDDITWTQLDPLPTPNSINGATALDGKIYMLGGFLNLMTVTNEFWEYDPGTSIWTQPENYVVPVVRNHMVIARQGHDEIYAVAGDANGDWGPPNNYYYKIARWVPGIAEFPDPVDIEKTSFVLSPNIGNRMVTISFSLASPSRVSLALYNTLGQKVMSVLDSKDMIKSHSVNLSLRELPSGVYFVNLVTDNSSMTQKLVITK